MRSITEIVKQFKQDWTEEINRVNIEQACRDSGMRWVDSILNPVTTIQIFFLQILRGNTAITDLPHLARMTFTAAAYCKARMRIKLEVFELLLKRCGESLQQQTLDTGRWLGHRVFMVDGSNFSMADTPDLQRYFGQPGGQKPGCGFSVAHWLVLTHMGTGMITKMLTSPLRTGEMTRMAELHPELQKSDVLSMQSDAKEPKSRGRTNSARQVGTRPVGEGDSLGRPKATQRTPPGASKHDLYGLGSK